MSVVDKPPSPADSPPPSGSTPSLYAQQVSEPSYIRTLLGQLLASRSLLRLSLPGHPEPVTSTLLAVESDSNTLLCDEIFPSAARAVLSYPLEAVMHASFAGARLEARLSLLEPVDDSGLRYYRLGMPERIEYSRRRTGHRVKVINLRIPAKLYDDAGGAHPARLYDISAAGVSLLVNDAKPFRNAGIYRCTLYPPQEAPFHGKVEICCRREEKTHGRTILGATYLELDRRSEHQLAKLVSEFERRLLRLRRGSPQDAPSP